MGHKGKLEQGSKIFVCFFDITARSRTQKSDVHVKCVFASLLVMHVKLARLVLLLGNIL